MVSLRNPDHTPRPASGSHLGWGTIAVPSDEPSFVVRSGEGKQSETAADRVVRGLEANRAMIAFPAILAAMSWIGGILPDRLRRLTARPFSFTVAGRDTP